MTVAEKAQKKAEEMALARKEETALAQSQGGILGIEGLESEDLNMPYVYLVRGNSKHAVKADGKKASAGNYFHNVKKEEFAEMEIIMAHAKKGATAKSDEDDTPVAVWRALCLPTSNLYSPFVMSFKGMNHWYGWKPFVSLLMAEGITDIKTKVLKLTSKIATTGSGNEYEVPVIAIVRDSTPEEIEVAQSMVDRFAIGMDQVVDEDTDINEKLKKDPLTEELDNADLPDLDSLID